MGPFRALLFPKINKSTRYKSGEGRDEGIIYGPIRMLFYDGKCCLGGGMPAVHAFGAGDEPWCFAAASLHVAVLCAERIPPHEEQPLKLTHKRI
uniref:Uncharacterized protein n=1 Tax=Candidozyma auris TaxID=498019 RepID=A0A0L0P1T0_CANAR